MDKNDCLNYLYNVVYDEHMSSLQELGIWVYARQRVLLWLSPIKNQDTESPMLATLLMCCYNSFLGELSTSCDSTERGPVEAMPGLLGLYFMHFSLCNCAWYPIVVINHCHNYNGVLWVMKVIGIVQMLSFSLAFLLKAILVHIHHSSLMNTVIIFKVPSPP